MLRRAFLSRFPALASIAGLSVSTADAQTPAPASASPVEAFRPARHAKDDWLDQIPGVHRVFFDATTAPNVREAVMFATNTLSANKSGYGLDDKDLALVICLRHRATPFAFNDAMWAKYGRQFSEILEFVDPKTKDAPATNIYTGIPKLVGRGVHLAVCDMASHAYSRMISEKTDGDPDAIYKELVANAFPNSHFMAAGIVAVNRAQERGYSVVHIG